MRHEDLIVFSGSVRNMKYVSISIFSKTKVMYEMHAIKGQMGDEQ